MAVFKNPYDVIYTGPRRGKDLTGKTFGDIKVIEYSHTKIVHNKRTTPVIFWKCICGLCGKEFETYSEALIHHNKTNCGCMRKSPTLKDGHGYRYLGGISTERLYYVHNSMIQRCYNPNTSSYHLYGAKGITVCDEWNTPGVIGNPGYMAFKKWSYENGYYIQPKDTPFSEKLSIDRIKGYLGYSPDNCRWIPFKEQASNISTNNKIWNGEKFITRAQFERDHGWPADSIYSKYSAGWDYSAIMFAANHPELGIHKFKGKYYDKDGFQHLIPKIFPPAYEKE